MGILEFFGTLIKNDITASSIRSNFSEKIDINHFLLDFNSIIHVSSVKVIGDINAFLQQVLKNLYEGRGIHNEWLTDTFKKYKMENIQKKINQQTSPEDVIGIFHDHFTDKLLDKLIITDVINNILFLLRNYCYNESLKTLLLAIDGVPSKGKMVEQKQRRYMGVIMEDYKRKIFHKYKNYLHEQKDYIYLTTKYSIKWTRNKITPGTAFMHKLVNYLKSDNVQSKLRKNRPHLKIIISDMYEIGEGEKKIVNYINAYLKDISDGVMVYSPDADVILLCILLPVKKVYMLRHNQQASQKSNVYDLIDIRMLKSNISYYINNHPDYSKAEFDTDKINYDIVCMSTLFGNDFVPKIETINVKSGFQIIIDAYLKTLIQFKDKNYYLIKFNKESGQFNLNFIFLKNIFRFLLPEENYFINHNDLFAKYISMGQIKNVFDKVDINSENLVIIFNSFRKEYDELKHLIRQNGNLSHFEHHDEFMNSLKKSINITIDNQNINITYLSNKEIIKTLKNYYRKYNDFPRLNINLNTWSHSIDDYIHKQHIKGKDFNDYQKEVYKFEKMLDEYYVKFNAQPLSLSKDKINEYYEEYFGMVPTDKTNKLTQDAIQVMHTYVEGMLWVFNYYFNDTSYINRWYYIYERAPLLKHISMFLDNINREYFNNMFNNLDKYHVSNLKKYFNPIEQLIYVSPMTDNILQLLPSNYRSYLTSDDLDPFLKTYFVDTKEITDQLWQEKKSKIINCRGIHLFNKCLIKSIPKTSSSDDEQFLKAIRKVKPNEISIRRSRMIEPPY